MSISSQHPASCKENHLHVAAMAVWDRLAPQLCQQGFGLLEIDRVKALCEPAVDLCQQPMGRGPLPLLLPEPRETQRGAQLQRLRLLAAGDLKGLLETRFCLGNLRARKLQQQLPLE